MSEQTILHCDAPVCDATVDVDDDAADSWLHFWFRLTSWSENQEAAELDVCSTGCLAPAVDWALLDAERTEP